MLTITGEGLFKASPIFTKGDIELFLSLFHEVVDPIVEQNQNCLVLEKASEVDWIRHVLDKMFYTAQTISQVF